MAGENNDPPVQELTGEDICTTIEMTMEDSTDIIAGTLGKLNLTASICIISGCKKKQSSNMLRCNKCKQLIHFKCTSLPAYQIHHFVNTKSYRRYECSSCSGTIPPHICASIEQIPVDNEEFRDRIKALENENKMNTDENITLRNDNNHLKRQLEIKEKCNEILRKAIHDKEEVGRINQGNEIPATPSRNINSQETTEESNANER